MNTIGRVDRITADVRRVRGLLNLLLSLMNSTLTGAEDRENASTGLDDFLSCKDREDLSFLLQDGTETLTRIFEDALALHDELRTARGAGPPPTEQAA